MRPARKGDNLESVYWLYNRTGEPWLLELAEKIHRWGANWAGGIHGDHGVDFSQGFREPAEYFLQSGNAADFAASERNYRTVMDVYGQFPGGGHAADENRRKGYVDPRQGFETCSWVEFMHSFEMLTKISGKPLWADRCEEIAFNSFPASMTPDLKGLHYLTAPNQPQLDRLDKSPGIGNGGPMFMYSPWEFTCCQHNVSHGWPYYAEELWLATGDKGLCASLYAASEVAAKVGDGDAVTIAETTDYPFADAVELKLAMAKGVRFPLYLRIPRVVSRSRRSASTAKTWRRRAEPLSYVRIERDWSPGDVVSLRLPMTLGVHTWTKNKNAVSVSYGPLWFSLAIGQRWSRFGGTDKWPGWEVLSDDAVELRPGARREGAGKVVRDAPEHVAAGAAAVYARVRSHRASRQGPEDSALDAQRPGADRHVAAQPGAVGRAAGDGDADSAGRGAVADRRVSDDRRRSAERTIGWSRRTSAASASYSPSLEAADALSNGSKPASSNDQKIPRFTWWPHSGSVEWVQYEFMPPRKISTAEVYWFDDRPKGGCRVPASWRLLYKDGEAWKPVEGASGYGTKPDQFNRTTFRGVQTRGLRLEVQLQQGFSGGILQWKIGQ